MAFIERIILINYSLFFSIFEKEILMFHPICVSCLSSNIFSEINDFIMHASNSNARLQIDWQISISNPNILWVNIYTWKWKINLRIEYESTRISRTFRLWKTNIPICRDSSRYPENIGWPFFWNLLGSLRIQTLIQNKFIKKSNFKKNSLVKIINSLTSHFS